MVAKGAAPERIAATLGPRICGDCYEVGDEIADHFIALPADEDDDPFRRRRHRHRRSRDDRPCFRRCYIRWSIRARACNAATQYLYEDPELAELCRTDGEGPAELAERIDNISHSMCTLENPLWYSHRRASLANKTHEGRLLALIVRDQTENASTFRGEDVMQFTDGQPSPYGGAYD